MAAREADAMMGPTLLYAVKQVELAVRAQMDAVLKPHNVTTIQYTALTVLQHRNDLTSAALARRSFVTAQTMGDIVTALERRGYIVRNPDPAHAKRLTISLTDEGKRLLADVRQEVEAIERQMTLGFDSEEQEELRVGLQRCFSNLTAHAGEDALREMALGA
ncbi:MarR family transcriptional regulator [Sinomonas sp. ASV486]|uniref:MarR family winged helix-turn-helix transcriptional regulator n=1 Tax=Sinomonas sp. ASV486 TaxID=3051170 RepID=UPI0027DB958C|nr:MarR family transcriptional regulator [Sinomonas sp. ASV486]MDQ4489800.1 MarR family transcriptional regulator [Sinomonas sp. ASV486]